MPNRNVVVCEGQRLMHWNAGLTKCQHVLSEDWSRGMQGSKGNCAVLAQRVATPRPASRGRAVDEL